MGPSEGVHEVECILNDDTVFLFYLSQVYRINFEMLLHLYEKYREDVFFIFYLFADQKVNFPSTTKMIKMKERAGNFMKLLASEENLVFTVKQEQEVFEALKKRARKTDCGYTLDVEGSDEVARARATMSSLQPDRSTCVQNH